MSKPRAVDKHLTQQLQSKPQQFGLFELLAPGDDAYSNTVELYDSMPKYVIYGSESTSLENAILERDFEYRNHRYRLLIKPMLLRRPMRRLDKDGGTSVETTTVLAYPGIREEIVEDALRKLAVNGKGIFLDSEVGVVFTLYELQQELRRTRHEYSIVEIKEALYLLRETTLECIDVTGKTIVNSGYFTAIGLTTKSTLDQTRCYVRFNPLVTKSILDLSFRQFNYLVAMSFRKHMARYIYKRLSHHWLQASDTFPYTILLTTLYRDSGRRLHSRMTNNKTSLLESLQELMAANVIDSHEVVPVREGRMVVDYRITLRPHADFIKDTKRANYHGNKLRLVELKGKMSALA